MRFNEYKKASFANRLLTLLAQSLLLVFVVAVATDNREVLKILPNTTARKLTLLVGPWVTILLTNYMLALRGKNFMDWRTELVIVSNFVLFFSLATLPWFFATEADEMTCRWWEEFFFGCADQQAHLDPNFMLLGFFVLQLPFLLYAIARVRAFVSQTE